MSQAGILLQLCLRCWIIGVALRVKLGFLFLRLIYLFYVYKCSICIDNFMPEEASEPTINGCEPPCGYWELNSGPLEEQPVRLTSEPSVQPQNWVFMFCLEMDLVHARCSAAEPHPNTRSHGVEGLRKALV